MLSGVNYKSYFASINNSTHTQMIHAAQKSLDLSKEIEFNSIFNGSYYQLFLKTVAYCREKDEYMIVIRFVNLSKKSGENKCLIASEGFE